MCNNEREKMGTRIREIPEDIEWPRYYDGELVDIGDLLRQGMVVGVEMRTEGYHIECLRGSVEGPYGACVIRPALAADGEVVMEGETVWNAATGEEFKVVDVRGGYVYLGKNGSPHVDLKLLADALTHKRPVLDANGEPLKVGQTVWAESNGDELVILAFEDGGHTVTCRYAGTGDGIPVHGMWSPSDLTGTRPVLDADGAPIKDGDTVFMTNNWRRGTVVGFEDDFALVEYDARDVNGSTMTVRTAGGCLTHKPPIRDADGKLIRPGDVVYANADESGDGTAWRVRSLNPGLAHSVKAERADGSKPALVRDLVPKWLTHEPDTWERNLVRRCKRLAERGEAEKAPAMPEGIEWPRWDDGELVTVVPPFRYDGRQACKLCYDGGVWFLLDPYGDVFHSIHRGETLERSKWGVCR